MSALNHIAEAAAVLLLIELIVVILVLLAVAGGLAFGLRWARGKLDWASGKANGYLGIATKYVHIGTEYAAKPFILAGGWAERVKGTAQSVRDQVQRLRQEPPVVPEVAARPIPPVAEETESLTPLA